MPYNRCLSGEFAMVKKAGLKWISAVLAFVCIVATAAYGDSFSFNSDKVLLVNGTRKVFPIGLTTPPPPAATTPTLKNAYQELRDGGVTFIRTGINSTWDTTGLAIEKS